MGAATAFSSLTGSSRRMNLCILESLFNSNNLLSDQNMQSWTIPRYLQKILLSFTPCFAYCTFPISLFFWALEYLGMHPGKKALQPHFQMQWKSQVKILLLWYWWILKGADWGSVCYLSIPDSVLNPKQPCRKGKASECSRHPPYANPHHPMSSRVRLAILWECQKDRRPSGAID